MHYGQSICKYPEVKWYPMRVRGKDLGGGRRDREEVNQKRPKSLAPFSLSARTHSGYPHAFQVEKTCLRSQCTFKNVCDPDVPNLCPILMPTARP